MASPDLARPANATSNFLVEHDGTTAHTTLGLAGGDYHIKTFRASFRFRIQIAESTGDGDTAPEFVSNEYIESSIALRGAMIDTSGDKVGVQNLVTMDDVTTNNNPVSTPMRFNLSGNRSLFFESVLLDTIDFSYTYDAPMVGISVTGVGHNQVVSGSVSGYETGT